DEKAPLLVGDIDVGTRIDQYVLGLIHELCGKRAKPLRWCRRDEPTNFARQPRILDVVDSQARVEVCQVDQIPLLFDVWQVVLQIGIVRPKAASLVTN